MIFIEELFASLKLFLPFPFFVATGKSDLLFSCFSAFPALSHFDNSAIFAFFGFFLQCESDGIHTPYLPRLWKMVALKWGQFASESQTEKTEKKGDGSYLVVAYEWGHGS